MNRWWLFLGLLGLAGVAVGVWLRPTEAAYAWLTAHRMAFGIGFGALVWLAIAELAPIGWFGALRPAARALGAVVYPVALGWIPVLLAMPWLYPWVAEPNRPGAVTIRTWWLSEPVFAVRTVAVLAVGVGLAALVQTERRLAWALVAAMAGGAGWCLFAFDAWMSLDPSWKSSIYGFLAFGSGLRDSLAALILVAAVRDAGAPEQLPPDLWHALGRLLLMTLMLWTYLQYSQLLLIWIAGLPLEIGFYLDRWRGLARIGSWVLVAGVFGLGASLLSRSLKRSRTGLVFVASAVLVFGWVDASWTLLPEAPGPIPVVLLAAATAVWVAAVVATVAFSLAGEVPDASVQASYAYRSR